MNERVCFIISTIGKYFETEVVYGYSRFEKRYEI